MHRILTDQDFDEDVVRGLMRRVELDWARVRDFGYQERDDSAVLALAIQQTRILLTHDARTLYPLVYGLLAEAKPTPRVIVVPQSMALRQAIEELEIVLRASLDRDWEYPVRLPF